jgi:phosphoglucomutase
VHERKSGLRILFEDGSRIVFRLSGTGTEGATLRLYIERYVAAGGELGLQTGDALGPLIAAAEELALISAYTQREQPSVIT